MAKTKKKTAKKSAPTKKKVLKKVAINKTISIEQFRNLVLDIFLVSRDRVIDYSKSYGIDGKELADVLIDSELETEVQSLVEEYLENRLEELKENLDSSKLTIIR